MPTTGSGCRSDLHPWLHSLTPIGVHFTFRARWVSGSRQFHTRLYFNRLARTTLLDAPALHGTPGTPNTALTTNLGPTYARLRHDPPVPAPFAPVAVSVEATDPGGVAAMTLWWRPDGGAWPSVPMSTDSAALNRFSGSLPGKSSGTVLQFFVEGFAALGAQSCFPADGTNSRALVQLDDGLAATNGLHNVRLVTLRADADDLLRTVNVMSNERIGCTVIYDERENFYDCGLRLKGSEHSRTTTPRLGFNVSFSSERMFRGIHRPVAIDRSESTGFGQREMLVHQTLNPARGTTTNYHDLIQVLAPRPEYTRSAELQLARYTAVAGNFTEIKIRVATSTVTCDDHPQSYFAHSFFPFRCSISLATNFPQNAGQKKSAISLQIFRAILPDRALLPGQFRPVGFYWKSR